MLLRVMYLRFWCADDAGLSINFFVVGISLLMACLMECRCGW